MGAKNPSNTAPWSTPETLPSQPMLKVELFSPPLDERTPTSQPRTLPTLQSRRMPEQHTRPSATASKLDTSEKIKRALPSRRPPPFSALKQNLPKCTVKYIETVMRLLAFT